MVAIANESYRNGSEDWKQCPVLSLLRFSRVGLLCHRGDLIPGEANINLVPYIRHKFINVIIITGLPEQLAHRLQQYNIDICCITEVIWPHSAVKDVGEWKLVFSERDDGQLRRVLASCSRLEQHQHT